MFVPPLKPVRAIQLINFLGGGSDVSSISCDLVMSSRSYSNIGVPITQGVGAVKPCTIFTINLNYLASGTCPIVNLEEYATKTPMKNMTLTVNNVTGSLIKFPFVVCLKLYH